MTVEQVHREHGKLHARTALDEEHRIVVGDVEQFPDIRFRAVDHRFEKLAAVGELHDAAAAILIIGEFRLRTLHDFLRQHGRPGCKIINCHDGPLLLNGLSFSENS